MNTKAIKKNLSGEHEILHFWEYKYVNVLCFDEINKAFIKTVNLIPESQNTEDIH